MVSEEECEKTTCQGVPKSQVPGGACTKLTCADLKKKKKGVTSELGVDGAGAGGKGADDSGAGGKGADDSGAGGKGADDSGAGRKGADGAGAGGIGAGADGSGGAGGTGADGTGAGGTGADGSGAGAKSGYSSGAEGTDSGATSGKGAGAMAKSGARGRGGDGEDDLDRAKSVEYGDRMNAEDDDDNTLSKLFWAFFGHKYTKKLLKALLLFLLGCKISRECRYMLIPMMFYSPWREPPFVAMC